MADKENNDVEGFDAEIEEAAASLDADSSLSLTNDTKLKPAPSNDLSKSNEQDEPAQDTEQKDPGIFYSCAWVSEIAPELKFPGPFNSRTQFPLHTNFEPK